MTLLIGLSVSNGLMKNFRLISVLQSRLPIGIRIAATARAGGNYGKLFSDRSVQQKPKRPLSPYFRFMAVIRGGLKEENPNLANSDIIKLIAEKWLKLDSSSKDHYTALFNEEMIPYTAKLIKYKDSHSLKEQHIVKEQNDLRIERRVLRKRLKDLGKPKRPAPPFLQFFISKFTSGSGQGMGGVKELLKRLSIEWKNMSETEKAPFITRYHRDSEVHRNAILKWENAMIKQGNEDLVRRESIRSKFATHSGIGTSAKD